MAVFDVVVVAGGKFPGGDGGGDIGVHLQIVMLIKQRVLAGDRFGRQKRPDIAGRDRIDRHRVEHNAEDRHRVIEIVAGRAQPRRQFRTGQICQDRLRGRPAADNDLDAVGSRWIGGIVGIPGDLRGIGHGHRGGGDLAVDRQAVLGSDEDLAVGDGWHRELHGRIGPVVRSLAAVP